MPMNPYVKRGPVRARDVRSTITEMGFERGVVDILERMAEEHGADRQTMRDLAELVQMMVPNIERMIAVGEQAKTQIEEVKRARDQGDAIDHGNQ